MDWILGDFENWTTASGPLQSGAFDNDPSIDVLPDRDEQLTGEGHDHRLLQAPAVVPHPLPEPGRER